MKKSEFADYQLSICWCYVDLMSVLCRPYVGVMLTLCRYYVDLIVGIMLTSIVSHLKSI